MSVEKHLHGFIIQFYFEVNYQWSSWPVLTQETLILKLKGDVISMFKYRNITFIDFSFQSMLSSS